MLHLERIPETDGLSIILMDPTMTMTMTMAMILAMIMDTATVGTDLVKPAIAKCKERKSRRPEGGRAGGLVGGVRFQRRAV